MGNILNLTGQKIGRLTVISVIHGNRNTRVKWVCKCECGNETTVTSHDLRKNNPTKSCGCLHKEIFGSLWITHGMSGTPEHKIWKGMVARCNDKKNKLYGGRGINVCERWRMPKGQGFANFYNDMGIRPSVLHSVERCDPNGNYEPSNCKWIPEAEQTHNRRLTIKVWYKNEIVPLAIPLKELGIDRRNFHSKKKRNKWTNQETFNYYALPKTSLIPHSFGYII